MVYTDAGGTGFPAVFLHGSGCDSTDWSPTIQGLPADFRPVTLDFRGHGRAGAPNAPFTLQDLAGDVVRLTTELGFQSVLLVGHSLGGMVAVEVARRCERVAALVLLEGWTRLDAARAFDDRHMFGSLSQDAIDAICRKAERTQGRFGPGMWERFWESIARFDAYDYLLNARIPVTEVFGAMGRIDSTERNLFVPANPNIEWVWIPDAGHYLPHERPDEVAEIVRRSLQKHFRHRMGPK